MVCLCARVSVIKVSLIWLLVYVVRLCVLCLFDLNSFCWWCITYIKSSNSNNNIATTALASAFSMWKQARKHKYERSRKTDRLHYTVQCVVVWACPSDVCVFVCALSSIAISNQMKKTNCRLHERHTFSAQIHTHSHTKRTHEKREKSPRNDGRSNERKNFDFQRKREIWKTCVRFRLW